MRQKAKGLKGQESQFKVILCAVGSHGQAFKMGKEIIRFHFCKALSCGGVAKGLQEPKIEWGWEGIAEVKTNKNFKKNECNSDIKRGAEKTKTLLFIFKVNPTLKKMLKLYVHNIDTMAVVHPALWNNRGT